MSMQHDQERENIAVTPWEPQDLTVEQLTLRVREQQGFGPEAWENFTEVLTERDTLEQEVSVLRDIALRSAVLVRWFSREDFPWVELTREEQVAIDTDARALHNALIRAGTYQDGWGS